MPVFQLALSGRVTRADEGVGELGKLVHAALVAEDRAPSAPRGWVDTQYRNVRSRNLRHTLASAPRFDITLHCADALERAVAHRQQVAAQGLHQRGLPGTLHHPRQFIPVGPKRSTPAAAH